MLPCHLQERHPSSGAVMVDEHLPVVVILVHVVAGSCSDLMVSCLKDVLSKLMPSIGMWVSLC